MLGLQHFDRMGAVSEGNAQECEPQKQLANKRNQSRTAIHRPQHSTERLIKSSASIALA